MKRFASLVLIVFALAAVPAAFADDTTPPAAPTTPAVTQQQGGGHPIAQIRLEMLRIRLQLVRLQYRIACHDKTSDTCTTFTQKVVTGLTTLDKNVQAKITSLNCTADSTDKKCDVLSKLDQRLQKVVAKLGAAPSSPDSGLDAAAGQLGGIVGSTKP